jgi:thiol:disulfide interchange protein DsbC
MLRSVLTGLLIVAGMLSLGAHADETKIRQKLQAKFPNMAIDSIIKAPFAGLYEVVLDGEIVYTDEKAEYFFGGNIYDIRTLPPRNLTQDSASRLTVKTLQSSTGSAIKRVTGNGSRTIYTFEDPNCGYCKQLYRELAKVNDITHYVFLIPILGQDSYDKSRAVWCARDRAKAWDDIMQARVVPAPANTCSTPIDQNLQLMRRFGIRGTPAIYLADGQQIGGYLPAEKIEQALKTVTVK